MASMCLLVISIFVALLPLSSDGQCTGDPKPGGAASWDKIVNPASSTPYCTREDRSDPHGGSGNVGALVSAHWLRCQLLSGFTDSVMLFDTGFGMGADGHGKYLRKGHIPGALYFDMNECVTALPTCARNFPEVECFKDYLKSLGINKDSRVVFYDSGSMVSAPRAWWTLRAFGFEHVSVLDGGFLQWTEDGNDVSHTEEKRPRVEGNAVYNMRHDIVVHFEDMVKIIKSGTHQIVDVRKPENFFGEISEPSPLTCSALESMDQPVPSMMQCGHIPGAINLEYSTVMQPGTGLLRGKEKLKKIIGAHNIDLNRPITTLCYNGNTAALVALAFHRAGKEDVSVYYGSWTEWGQKSTPQFCTKDRPLYKHG